MYVSGYNLLVTYKFLLLFTHFIVKACVSFYYYYFVPDLQVPLCAANDTVLCLFPTYSKLQLQRCFKQYHDQFVSIKCFNNRQSIVDRYIRWLLRQFILSKFN